MRTALIRSHVAVICFAAACVAPSLAAAQGTCDRGCLTRIADNYFAAIAAHDPAKASLAASVRFTEQAQVTSIGEGLWKTASEAPTTFKIYVPDPVAGQIGGIVMMKDAGKPIEIGFRLKVRDGRITEAEHLISPPITNPTSLANLVTPRPGLLETVPERERLPREVMLLYGHGYYDALTNSDGSAVPFADDCVRHENGIHTAGPRSPAPTAAARGQRAAASTADTPPRYSAEAMRARAQGAQAPAGPATSAQGSAFGGMTCAGQLDTRFMSYIEEISLRRVWIADEEKGLVFGLSEFRHPMNVKVLTLINPDGTRGERDMTTQRTFDMAAAHIFKIRNHKIHEIEATGFTLPLNSKNGWSDFLR